MHNVTTSRHIRPATELFIMVPIKNDFVPITELVLTYAGRVSAVLKLLGDIRQQKTERGFGDPNGPIEQLDTIFRVQWSVLQPFDDVKSPAGVQTRQLKQSQILLTSHFDSSWEDYFRALVEIGGPLLDLIFSHCEGYEGHSCKDGFEQFSDFVRSHQRPVDFYYATAPEVTIDDVRYFNRLPKQLLDDPAYVRTLTVPTILAESRLQSAPPTVYDDRTRAAHRTIQALLDVRKRLFPSDGCDGGIVVPGGKRLTDRMLFENAVRSILKHEPDLVRLASVLNPHSPAVQRAEVELPEFVDFSRELKLGELNPRDSELVEAALWVEALVGSKPQEGDDISDRNTASGDAEAPGLPRPEDLFADVQGNILSGYVGIDQGRLLMFQCTDADSLRALLQEAHSVVTTEADSQARAELKPRCNIAITYSGIKLLGLPTHTLELFPREFREGMEERAGILGDIGPNHPSSWRLPRHESDGGRLHLSRIHAVVIVLGRNGEAFDAALQQWTSRNGRELIHKVYLTSTAQPERSQPTPTEPYRAKNDRAVLRDEVSLNQFLLGYANVEDLIPVDDKGNPLPRAYPTDKGSTFDKLLINGSFVAMRKMMQDDHALDAYLAQVATLIADVARANLEFNARLAATGSRGFVSPSSALLDRAALLEDARALIIGRRKDGTLLGDIQPPAAPSRYSPAAPPSNDFDFTRDPGGDVCPFQSHVRRTNPRIPDTPRIVRRGLAYAQEPDGPEKGERGLVFMAYCANLARQYEVVQRWVNGANSTGILSRQNDMLCGAQIENDIQRVVSLKGTSVARLVGSDATITLPPRDLKKPFVSLRWGLYLFVPSKKGLLWFADGAQLDESRPDTRAAAVARGEARIRETEALPTSALRAFEWKRILEEVPEAGSTQARQAEDVAAAITDKWGGVIVVSKIVDDESAEVSSESRPERADRADGTKRDMVVVTTERLALEVLSRDTSFSVRHYRARMNRAIQDHYLGYDIDTRSSGLSYRQLSAEPNALFEALKSDAFAQARTIANKILDEPGTIELDPDHQSPDKVVRSTISVRDLASAVIAELCHDWLDMPGEAGAKDKRRGLMNSLEKFQTASRYCFQVMPAAYLKTKAIENHESIKTDYGRLKFPTTQRRNSRSVTPSLIRDFRKHKLGAVSKGSGISETDYCKMAVLGTVGFAPPAVGALLRILDQWIETEELWQIQSLIRPQADEQEILSALLPKIYTAWSKTPAPPTLYRTSREQILDFGGFGQDRALKRSVRPRRVDIENGSRVVVNLAAVYADAIRNGKTQKEAGAWLFGGEHGGADRSGTQTRHGCPGRDAGLNALAGIITALLRRKSLRRERRFLLSYERPQKNLPR